MKGTLIPGLTTQNIPGIIFMGQPPSSFPHFATLVPPTDHGGPGLARVASGWKAITHAREDLVHDPAGEISGGHNSRGGWICRPHLNSGGGAFTEEFDYLNGDAVCLAGASDCSPRGGCWWAVFLREGAQPPAQAVGAPPGFCTGVAGVGCVGSEITLSAV